MSDSRLNQLLPRGITRASSLEVFASLDFLSRSYLIGNPMFASSSICSATKRPNFDNCSDGTGVSARPFLRFVEILLRAGRSGQFAEWCESNMEISTQLFAFLWPGYCPCGERMSSSSLPPLPFRESCDACREGIYAKGRFFASDPTEEVFSEFLKKICMSENVPKFLVLYHLALFDCPLVRFISRSEWLDLGGDVTSPKLGKSRKYIMIKKSNNQWINSFLNGEILESMKAGDFTAFAHHSIRPGIWWELFLTKWEHACNCQELHTFQNQWLNTQTHNQWSTGLHSDDDNSSSPSRKKIKKHLLSQESSGSSFNSTPPSAAIAPSVSFSSPGQLPSPGHRPSPDQLPSALPTPGRLPSALPSPGRLPSSLPSLVNPNLLELKQAGVCCFDDGASFEDVEKILFDFNGTRNALEQLGIERRGIFEYRESLKKSKTNVQVLMTEMSKVLTNCLPGMTKNSIQKAIDLVDGGIDYFEKVEVDISMQVEEISKAIYKIERNHKEFFMKNGKPFDAEKIREIANASSEPFIPPSSPNENLSKIFVKVPQNWIHGQKIAFSLNGRSFRLPIPRGAGPADILLLNQVQNTLQLR